MGITVLILIIGQTKFVEGLKENLLRARLILKMIPSSEILKIK
jgi:hypothetical protein